MSLQRRIRGAFETGLAYLGLAVIPMLPRSAIVKAANGLGAFAFRVAGKNRRVAMANVDVAFGNSISDEEKRNIVRRSFQSFTLVLLDLFWFARRTKERIAKHVTIDPSAQALRAVKPAISVTGHFGNWEILGQGVALLDPPFLAIAAHLKNSSIDRLLTKLRSGGSQQIAYKEGAVREAIRVLNEGGRVGFLLDQNIHPAAGGMFVDFFGLPVPMSTAAERLARKTGLPIIFGFCVADEKGHYVCRSPPALHLSDVAPENGEATRAIARVIETAIRENPGSWLWMYKRWKYVPPGAAREKYPFYSRPLSGAGRKRVKAESPR